MSDVLWQKQIWKASLQNTHISRRRGLLDLLLDWSCLGLSSVSATSTTAAAAA